MPLAIIRNYFIITRGIVPESSQCSAGGQVPSDKQQSQQRTLRNDNDEDD